MEIQNKTINAGELIKQIIEIADIKKINWEYLTEQEVDEILFSLGLPCSDRTLNIQY
jgi:hypothetical protein